MTPYCSTNKHKLQKFLIEKFSTILASKDYELACANINQYPALLADKLVEKFIPFGFPIILEEHKLVRVCSKTTRPSVRNFLGIKLVLNQQASDEYYNAMLEQAKVSNQIAHAMCDGKYIQTKQIRMEDCLVYEYQAYQLSLPVSGSRELALCIVSDEWSTTPGLPISELKVNSDSYIRSRYAALNDVFVEMEVCWPLPEKPADLSGQQIDSFKNQLNESIQILKHSFNRARKDYMDWEELSKSKLKESIRSHHDARRLEIQRIANEISRHKDAIDKLMDI